MAIRALVKTKHSSVGVVVSNEEGVLLAAEPAL